MIAHAGRERPNIRDVADLAGVSHMTVSRVLNGHPNIRPATRDRVLEVIEELNYRPSSAARALATSRTRCIGVIVESAVEYGPVSTLRAIESAARMAGYTVTSVALRGDSEIPPSEAVARLTAQGVDAICVIAPRSSSLASLREGGRGIPVLIVKADDDPHFLTLSVDQAQGAELAVDHLVALGHRDIVHIAGPLDWFDARARERAFHRRITHHGLKHRPVIVGDWTADFGYGVAASLDGPPDYTAAFVSNDEMALGFLHGLHDRGIRVPDDVSVVGFDDIPTARHFIPPLTTVRQDFYALGTRTMGVILAALDGAAPPVDPRIPAELMVRQSTAAPRSVPEPSRSRIE